MQALLRHGALTASGWRAFSTFKRRAVRLSSSLENSGTFEEWIARNLPPSVPDKGKLQSWHARRAEQVSASARHASTQKLRHALQAAQQEYSYRWEDTSAVVAAVQHTHHITWCSQLGGYLCSPRAFDYKDIQHGQDLDLAPGHALEQAFQHSSKQLSMLAHQVLSLMLPRTLWPQSEHMGPQNALDSACIEHWQPGRQLIALLSADSAALGICSGGALAKHKTFTCYTVRKCQGRSQLAHLRSGGGGKSVGGRIRMRETKRLFEAVASRLYDWQDEIEGSSHFLFSGGVRVWNEVFMALGSTSFLDRRDARWHKIPRSIPRPRLQDLQRAASSMNYGTVAVLQSRSGV